MMPQEGEIVRNKRTGEQGIFRGGQVVPMGSATPSTTVPPAFIPGAVSPYRQAAEQRAQAGESRAQQDQQIQAQSAGIQAAQFDLESLKFRADEQDRQAKRAKEAAEQAEKAGKFDTAKTAARSGLVTVLEKLNTIERSAKDGWFTTGTSGSLMRRFAPDGTDAFDLAENLKTVDATSAFTSLQAMRDASPTGGALGQITERELDLLKSKVSNLNPNQSEEQFMRNLDDARAFYIEQLQRVDPDAAKEYTGGGSQDQEEYAPVARTAGETVRGPKPPPLSPGGPSMVATGEGRTVTDPAMKAIGDEYRSRLGSGQTAREIIPWLKTQNVTDETLLGAIRQLEYRKNNPDVPISEYSIQTTKSVPLTIAEKVATSVGDTTGGAYAIGAADFLSAGTLDNISADPQRTRNALGVIQAQRPTAFGVGQVSGGVLAALTGEAGLARAGMSSGLGRSVLADAGMGGAYGAGSADEGGRFENALLGAAVGAGASYGGAKVMGGVARAIAPTGAGSNALYRSGVRPTPGQRFAGRGAVGRTINATEEKLQSVPFMGDAIRGARDEARDQFQEGAFNLALEEVGEQLPEGIKKGTRAHSYAQKVFDDVYDEARSGMRVVGDEQFITDVNAFRAGADQLSDDSRKRFDKILKDTVIRRIDDGGAMSGDSYKKVYSDLGKRIRAIRNSANGDGELADSLMEVQSAMDGAARRNSPPEAVAVLDAADRGYAKFVRIEDAAMRRGGDQGEFSPLQFDSAVQRTSGGTRSKAYLRGDALMQDYASEARNLGDYTPNSGTVDRAMAAGAAAGAGFIEPTTLAAMGSVGAAYGPGRKMLKGAIAPREGRARVIANALEKRRRMIAAISGASAAQGALGTSPDQ